MSEQDTGHTTGETRVNNLPALGRESWAVFCALVTAYAKDSHNTPLTIKLDGQECPVLEVRQDGTARVEGPDGGELDFALAPAHIHPLYAQIAREFNLSLSHETEGLKSMAAAGGAGGTSGGC